MAKIKLQLDNAYGFVPQAEIASYKAQAEAANKALSEKTGKGNDFIGWVNLPSSIKESELEAIQASALAIRKKNIDIFIVVGIGGSYLGAKSVIDALSSNFPHLQKTGNNPTVIFAGQNLCQDYTQELLNLLDGKEYAMAVISKSGTTTEPAVAFRILKNHIEAKYGKAEAASRIIAVTDQSRGALRQLATQEGYQTYVIPDDVGGRFSVLTPVGLLPIAVAGFDIKALVQGARDMEAATAPSVPFEENISAQYAAVRNALYKKGKVTEILVNYMPKLHYFAEWWKQLYGESEGKEGVGILPAAVDFTSDLHSMGQYIQEGMRNIFETVISVENTKHKVLIPLDADNMDKLNFLAGKTVDEVNKMAELGTVIAHIDGGVPNIRVSIAALDEATLGQLIYFFEKACGISGYILGINPFDQPGVEAYKANMFALLGKPGFEKETAAIQARIK